MKKLIFYTAFISALLLTAFTLSTPNQKVVIIDIGHGGKDHGASVEQVLEKEVNIQIANKIKELNKNEDLKLLFTRNGDEFISLDDRVAFVKNNDADILLSIHSNLGEKYKKGVELYYSRTNNSDKLAAHFKEHLSKTLDVSKVNPAGFKVLNEVKCPAIMIETGFLSNDEDRKRLTSEEGQIAIAKAILNGLK